MALHQRWLHVPHIKRCDIRKPIVVSGEIVEQAGHGRNNYSLILWPDARDAAKTGGALAGPDAANHIRRRDAKPGISFGKHAETDWHTHKKCPHSAQLAANLANIPRVSVSELGNCSYSLCLMLC